MRRGVMKQSVLWMSFLAGKFIIEPLPLPPELRQ